jgi:hypothetical protein
MMLSRVFDDVANRVYLREVYFDLADDSFMMIFGDGIWTVLYLFETLIEQSFYRANINRVFFPEIHLLEAFR